MTARENVAIPLELAGHRDAFALAEAALARVGLGHRLGHYPGQLSGGEQQRVAIARAFVAGPALLLADEPTGNLDRATGEAVIDYLFDEHARLGSALLLITHDAALAERCERRLDLADGRIIGEMGSASAGPPARPRRGRCAMPADDLPAAAPPRRIYGRRRGRPLRPGQRHLQRDAAAASRGNAARDRGARPGIAVRERPESVWLEIGFGAGEHLAAQAEAHPEIGFIGCEVFENGVARLVAEIARRDLKNIRIFPDDVTGPARRAGAGVARIGCSSCSRTRGRRRGTTSAGWSRPRRWTGWRC